MRVVYIDIDSLRADHLSCYGYPRRTSASIDQVAQEGVRFTNCYASDVPCAPSRMAMFSGRFGWNNGVVAHGGERADLYRCRADRVFSGTPITRSMWPAVMRGAGTYAATISSFAERHGQWSFLSGFREAINPGDAGHETAEEVTPRALKWLDLNGSTDNWFLHVNYWDVHVPYRLPDAVATGFDGDPPDSWMTDELLFRYRGLPGHRSYMDTFEMRGIRQESRWQPARITTRADFQKMQNSYDTAVAYVDRQVGMILQKLRDVGIYDETAIVITADHGEDLGEYGLIGHGFATQHTTRIPFVLKWPESVPGTHGRTDDALHYHFDLAATLLGLLGIDVPDAWDARCFADQFLAGEEEGREALVTSQLAQAIQRSLRFVHRSKHYTYSRTYFGFFHSIPCETLYNLTSDPFALNNVVDSEPEAAEGARTAYAEWLDRLPDTNAGYPDPLDSVLADRRKWAARRAPSYASRLIETGREEWADRLPGVRDSHAD